MVIIGIVVVLSNFFQPTLLWSRELKVLRFGFFLLAATGLIENIAPLLKKGIEISYLEGFGLIIFIGCLGILVADVSGHGVPASLISSMVKIAFASQTSHASDPARLLSEINAILCGKLEADFVTAGYLFIDSVEETFQYAGAGHPSLYVWRGAEQKIYEFRENGIILGQFADAQYQNISFNLKANDRIFL